MCVCLQWKASHILNRILCKFQFKYIAYNANNYVDLFNKLDEAK